jgi:hypothetical protein
MFVVSHNPWMLFFCGYKGNCFVDHEGIYLPLFVTFPLPTTLPMAMAGCLRACMGVISHAKDKYVTCLDVKTLNTRNCLIKICIT